jgi:cell division protein FtsQ
MWRRRNRRRPERPAIRWPAFRWRALAAVLAAVAVLAGSWFASTWILNRPIETIVINGAFQRVSPVQLEAMVEPYAHSGFLEVDLAATKRDLTALPWVASAEVRRKWPGTLEVRIREETPIALWGEHGLLNAAGELFLPDADHVPAELPHLSGPAGTEAKVTALYFRVQEQLEHRGMAAVSVALDARGAWTFQLANGVQVRLGANGVDERIDRFFRVLDGTLAHMMPDLQYVDMRYPNGFAVGWKGQDTVQAAAGKESGPNA